MIFFYIIFISVLKKKKKRKNRTLVYNVYYNIGIEKKKNMRKEKKIRNKDAADDQSRVYTTSDLLLRIIYILTILLLLSQL